MANFDIRKHCQRNCACSDSKEKHCQNVFEQFIGRLFLENLQSRKTIKCHKMPLSAEEKCYEYL